MYCTPYGRGPNPRIRGLHPREREGGRFNAERRMNQRQQIRATIGSQQSGFRRPPFGMGQSGFGGGRGFGFAPRLGGAMIRPYEVLRGGSRQPYGRRPYMGYGGDDSIYRARMERLLGRRPCYVDYDSEDDDDDYDYDDDDDEDSMYYNEFDEPFLRTRQRGYRYQ